MSLAVSGIIPKGIVYNGTKLNGIAKNGVKIWEQNKKVAYILDYIQSSGTQYIDTGICPQNGLIYSGQYSENTVGYGAVFGVEKTSSPISKIILTNKNIINGGTIAQEFGETFINATFEMNDAGVVMNGETFSKQLANIDLLENYKIALFAVYSNNSSVRLQMQKRLHYFNIKLNDNYLINYLPTKRISDNVNCMYDFVTNSFVENSGTGDFEGGEVVGYITSDGSAFNTDGTPYAEV